MMYQAAMESTVSILERVDVNESEGRRCCLQYRIERGLAHTVVCINDATHKVFEILRVRANEFRQRITLIIAVSEKNPFVSESRADEPPIFDQYSVQSNNLV
jgi:hypothetical protein